jgi:NADPH2:quinone reductase
MKAVVCQAFGPPENLVYTDVDAPVAGPRQVVISVRASGVSFPDTLIVQGKYQVKPPLPFSPGSEVAGIVKAVGSDVSSVKVGDRVSAFITWGGFAEEIVADEHALTVLPEGMDFAAASLLTLNYGTTYHALKDRGGLKEGETLLVLGAAGGVGSAAVELGKVMGARVIAAASSDEKLAVSRRHGADAVINYSSESLKERAKDLTGGNGADVVFDPVGDRYSEEALRAIAWQGRYLVIGFAAGDIPRIPLNLTLLKGCSIVGVFWGSFAQREPAHNRANLQQIYRWYVEGKLQPEISARYPLEHAVEALNEIIARRVKGKVILQVGEAE